MRLTITKFGKNVYIALIVKLSEIRSKLENCSFLVVSRNLCRVRGISNKLLGSKGSMKNAKFIDQEYCRTYVNLTTHISNAILDQHCGWIE